MRRPVQQLRLFLASLVLGAAAAAAAVPPAAAVENHKVFKSWEAENDLDGYGWLRTRAIGKPPENALPSGIELIRRYADDAPWHIVIVTSEPIDRHAAVTVLVDADRIAVPGDKLYARDDPRALTIQDQAALDRIGAKLRNAQTLAIEAHGASGPIAFKASLAGLAAAMLWLDDGQNRVGKPQSFAPFDKAKDIDPEETSRFKVSVALPPADKLPEDLRNLPRVLLEKHLARGGCDVFNGDLDGLASWQSYRLDPIHTAYGLACSAGAYNFGTRFYLVKAGDFPSAEPLMFASADGAGGWTGTDQVVNAELDEASGQLTEFNKGRGIGDCGTSAVWRWDGSAFRLVEYRYWEDCDHGRDSEKWPVIFKAKGK